LRPGLNVTLQSSIRAKDVTTLGKTSKTRSASNNALIKHKISA
jgi:hypothetical protein